MRNIHVFPSSRVKASPSPLSVTVIRKASYRPGKGSAPEMHNDHTSGHSRPLREHIDCTPNDQKRLPSDDNSMYSSTLGCMPTCRRSSAPASRHRRATRPPAHLSFTHDLFHRNVLDDSIAQRPKLLNLAVPIIADAQRHVDVAVVEVVDDRRRRHMAEGVFR